MLKRKYFTELKSMKNISFAQGKITFDKKARNYIIKGRNKKQGYSYYVSLPIVATISR